MNRLSKEEHITFLQEMESNPQLQKETALLAELINGIQLFEKQQLKKRIAKAIHQNKTEGFKVEEQKPIYPVFIKIIGAAAIVVLGLFLFQYLSIPKVAPDQLYETHFETYAFSIQQRSNDNPLYQKILDQYNAGAFELVIQTITEQEELSPPLLLLKANAEMAMNQFNAALFTLDQLIEQQTPQFTDHALWYKALSHLRLQQINAAQQALKRLSEDATADHHLEAQQLLRQLRKIN